MIMDMVDWHKMLCDKKISIFYSGPLWSEGIAGIAGTLKKHLEFDQITMETSHEVFSVFIEQMNNMLMYSAEKEKLKNLDGNFFESPKGTFILGKKDNAYFVQTGNVMRNESVELVKKRIDHLNTLDKKEQREFYKEQMRKKNDNPESKGSGLGFIEIARRITSKIEYSFTSYDEGLTFFTLFVTIGGDDGKLI